MMARRLRRFLRLRVCSPYGLRNDGYQKPAEIHFIRVICVPSNEKPSIRSPLPRQRLHLRQHRLNVAQMHLLMHADNFRHLPHRNPPQRRMVTLF